MDTEYWQRDDIVARLRMEASINQGNAKLCGEAADEIERLRLTDREQHCLRKAVEMLADDADREDGIARSQIAAVLSDVANRIG